MANSAVSVCHLPHRQLPRLPQQAPLSTRSVFQLPGNVSQRYSTNPDVHAKKDFQSRFSQTENDIGRVFDDESLSNGRFECGRFSCLLCGRTPRSLALATKQKTANSLRFVYRRLRRAGNSGSLNINKERIAERGLYLGSVTTILAKGEGCTDIAVSKVLKHSRAGASGLPVTLTVREASLRLECKQVVIANHSPSGEQPSQWEFMFRRISTCVVASKSRNILAWVYRHDAPLKRVVLRCHVVSLCSSKHTSFMVKDINRSRKMDMIAHKRPNRRRTSDRWVSHLSPISEGIEEFETFSHKKHLFPIPEAIEIF